MGGDPRWLLMEPCISIACLDSPPGCMGSRGTAGIRGWCGCREVDGSMDSRRVAVLLLLLLMDWGHAEGPGVQDEDPIFVEEDSGPHPQQHAQNPGSLLRSLLQAMERPGRSPAFLFQPQRFGRNAWGSWSKERLSPRSGAFWSLAAPQRFGKK
ncbi:pro-FMRFamide-related neuropeptide FF [Castor canadensis]|uniref:Pro-FMRFamide-related neuropeptide FF n=2 Tax=Castor canadensis TaxID=51338 RepID=A0A8B7U972_CASCN|nr:pro-FMRFamide-related neuropeptide FF [Castor canadensis]